MKLGIMQSYFMFYIGYFQMIKAKKNTAHNDNLTLIIKWKKRFLKS